jgi:short-subunit dehydrogenase
LRTCTRTQAVKTLAEALAHQLLSTSVSVHLLVPGWTWTKLASPAGGSLSAFSAADKPAEAWSAAEVAEELLTRMQQGEFYIICPDGAVNWELDKARMEWGLGDVLEKRPPLSRWHPEWEERHQKWVEEKLAQK